MPRAQCLALSRITHAVPSSSSPDLPEYGCRPVQRRTSTANPITSAHAPHHIRAARWLPPPPASRDGGAAAAAQAAFDPDPDSDSKFVSDPVSSPSSGRRNSQNSAKRPIARGELDRRQCAASSEQRAIGGAGRGFATGTAGNAARTV
ncbi:unnamed protein product [Closterium sp. NIES-54]